MAGHRAGAGRWQSIGQALLLGLSPLLLFVWLLTRAQGNAEQEE